MQVSQAQIIISGKVQGVFYRHSTRTKARDLGLSGWVRNRDDGSVEILACGDQNAIKNLIEWCHKGPSNAVVSNVLVEWKETNAITGTAGGDFEIR